MPYFWTIVLNLGVVGLAYLAYLCLFPEYIPFPQPRVGTRKGSVVYAGSFNPPHIGHLAILRALAGRYERVYAVVGFNPSKSYAVSPETRQAILAEMVGRIGLGDRVKVTTKSGLIWRYAKQVNACLCRGIRTWKKDGSSELFLNALNVFGPLLLGPFRSPMQTVILQGDPALAHVSSTRLRKAAAEGRVGDFRGLVPQGFETKVAKQWGRPNTERKGT